MKLSHVSILLLFVFALSLNYGCKDPEDVTPVSELILGEWRSQERQKDGIVEPVSEGYREINISDSLIIITDYESDGAEEDTWEDTWELRENNTQILLGSDEPFDFAEILYVDEDSLVLEYEAFDIFVGGTARFSDIYKPL